MVNIYGPDGRPVETHAEPTGTVVLQIPHGTEVPNIRALLTSIAKVTRCNVIVLPRSSELITGQLAIRELEAVHLAIHNTLGLPPVDFSVKELEPMYKAIKSAPSCQAQAKKIRPFIVE